MEDDMRTQTIEASTAINGNKKLFICPIHGKVSPNRLPYFILHCSICGGQLETEKVLEVE